MSVLPEGNDITVLLIAAYYLSVWFHRFADSVQSCHWISVNQLMPQGILQGLDVSWHICKKNKSSAKLCVSPVTSIVNLCIGSDI